MQLSVGVQRYVYVPDICISSPKSNVKLLVQGLFSPNVPYSQSQKNVLQSDQIWSILQSLANAISFSRQFFETQFEDNTETECEPPNHQKLNGEIEDLRRTTQFISAVQRAYEKKMTKSENALMNTDPGGSGP